MEETAESLKNLRGKEFESQGVTERVFTGLACFLGHSVEFESIPLFGNEFVISSFKTYTLQYKHGLLLLLS